MPHGDWGPVVRYDGSHGFAHLDIYHPDGTKVRTTQLPGHPSYEEAIEIAKRDIMENWRRYRDDFLERMR